ncbi:MAG: SRPBCC family protein [Dehalococcoidia bacterium]
MAVHVERSVHIDAPPEVVWRVWTDVERWPEWTASMRKITRLDEGPFGPHSSARVQANAPPVADWRVTAFDEGCSFKWEAEMTGAHATGTHLVERDGAGCKATMTISISGGLLTALLTPVFAAMSRRNLRLEAEGLKQQCEEMVGGAS